MKIKVESCRVCLFYDRDYNDCDVYEGAVFRDLATVWRSQIINSASAGSPPPSWCPLRAASITVELAGHEDA